MKKVIRIALRRQQFTVKISVSRHHAKKPNRLYRIYCDDCRKHIADLRPCYCVPVIMRPQWKAGAGMSQLSGRELCQQCLRYEEELGF